MKFEIEEDLFQIRDGSSWILYAPLLRAAVRTNGSLIDWLCDLRDGTPSLSGCGPEEIDRLRGCGILRAPGDERKQVRFEANGQAESQQVHLTLFLTSDCNLACGYCYGDGGDEKIDMPRKMAFAAIDHLFARAAALGARQLHLGFHGGGEPTLRMDSMVEFVRYAREQAAGKSVDLVFGLTTNGVMSEAAAEWIADNVKHPNISLDGPEEIQDFQRPTKNENGSLERVARTIRILERKRVPYHFRGTVTQFSQGRIPEIVKFLAGEFSPASIQLEPMFCSGRASRKELAPPACEAFVEGFLEAAAIGKKQGIRVHFSGLRFPQLCTRFCSIGRQNFAVTPQGWVTSCYEVLQQTDPRSEVFFFGTYESGERFSVDENKLKSLQVLSEIELPSCQDCFAKYHCAGDCRAKRLYADAHASDPEPTSRCEIIRALTRAQLSELLHSSAIVRVESAASAPAEC
jgi:uncharacterized protein